VVHLGGGSCEVTVLDVGGAQVERLAEGGDGFLGGDLLDSAVVQLLLTETEAARHPELQRDPLCLQRLREAAEAAKWALGEAPKTNIELRHLHTVGDEDLHLGLTLTRERLDQLAKPLVAGLRTICRTTLESARLTASDLDGVVLSGGQFRMLCLREAVADLFGREPLYDLDPEGTVARGAALEGLQQLGQADEPAHLRFPLR
jgi:molecular chaperone DnaK